MQANKRDDHHQQMKGTAVFFSRMQAENFFRNIFHKKRCNIKNKDSLICNM